MLYSPTLHQLPSFQKISAVGSINAASDQLIVIKANGDPQRIAAYENRREQWFIFDLAGSSDRATASLTGSLTLAKHALNWPNRFNFFGAYASVASAVNIATAANFAIFRNNLNVMNNASTVASLQSIIISGNVIMSPYVTPHASHAVWSRGDKISIWCTAALSAGFGYKGGKLYLNGAWA